MEFSYMFFTSEKQTISVLDVQKDCANYEILTTISKAQKLTQKLLNLRNEKSKRIGLLGETQSSQLNTQDFFAKKAKDQNLSKLEVEALREKFIKTENSLDSSLMIISRVLGINLMKQIQMDNQLTKHDSKFDRIRECLDKLDLSPFRENTSIVYKFENVPGDFIRDFGLAQKRRILVALSNDCHLSIFYYRKNG